MIELVMYAFGYFQCCGLDGHCFRTRHQTQLAVSAGRSPLDQTQRANECTGHRQSADWKIINRPLCLSTPKRIRRHL
jgi:hypothetical protein